jgi:hypothetical protein
MGMEVEAPSTRGPPLRPRPQVLLAHVPGRLEASDGEDGQPQVGEASPDLGEVRAPAGVSGEVH